MRKIVNLYLELEDCERGNGVTKITKVVQFMRLVRELETMNALNDSVVSWHLVGYGDTMIVRPDHWSGFWRWLITDEESMRRIRRINECSLQAKPWTKMDVRDADELWIDWDLLEYGCVFIDENCRLRLTRRFRGFLAENDVVL